MLVNTIKKEDKEKCIEMWKKECGLNGFFELFEYENGFDLEYGNKMWESSVAVMYGEKTDIDIQIELDKFVK